MSNTMNLGSYGEKLAVNSFHKMDKDSNGIIDYAEYQRAMDIQYGVDHKSKRPFKQRLKRFFLSLFEDH